MDIPIPPLTFVASFIIAFILYTLYPIERFNQQYIMTIIFIIVGIGIAMYSSYLLLKNKTTINPNETPSILIMNGPFSISRNPIYLSMVIVLLGMDFYFFSITSFIDIVTFFIILNFYIIPKEERNIKKKFKNEYMDYMMKVRRWI